jgi:hypothetical protein
MQCVSRSIPPRLAQGVTIPLDRVQRFKGPDRPGPWGLSSSLDRMCSRSRYESVRRQDDRAARARRKLRFSMLSWNWTTPQVDQVTRTEAVGDFS